MYPYSTCSHTTALQLQGLGDDLTLGTLEININFAPNLGSRAENTLLNVNTLWPLQDQNDVSGCLHSFDGEHVGVCLIFLKVTTCTITLRYPFNC